MITFWGLQISQHLKLLLDQFLVQRLAAHCRNYLIQICGVIQKYLRCIPVIL